MIPTIAFYLIPYWGQRRAALYPQLHLQDCCAESVFCSNVQELLQEVLNKAAAAEQTVGIPFLFFSFLLFPFFVFVLWLL